MRAGEQHADDDRPSEELVALVLRAGRLGFSRWRVATALGISAAGLEAIGQRAELTGSDDAKAAPTWRPPR